MIGKVAVVAPATTVTVAPTEPTAALFEERVTTYPPAGAGVEIVTVPIEPVPPTTDVGLIDRVVTVGNAVIANVPEAVTPPDVPVIVVLPAVVATVVPTVKVADVAPDATVTVAGIVTVVPV